MIVKKKKKLLKNETVSTYDFSSASSYYLNTFGKEDHDIKVYTLNITVGELLKDFRIFEDLNNVQSWPISTLIQRELDHDRASMICKDYLLKESDIKYFPPLVAVLIPIDNDFKPAEQFPDISEKERKSLDSKYIKDEKKYEEYEDIEALSGGVYKIPYDMYQGDLVWNKDIVSAVVIDGQHRYKALAEATLIDKSFALCKLTVNLVDLTDACNKTKISPTDIARDLFVTINNTPKEVDEARLILMDDKDALATFTQVLIDDAFEDEDPAVSPELIDWECEGAKHNIRNSLTGVLVLRQVILSALFDDSKVSTIDDKINPRNVRKWKGKIDSWLDVDKTIKSELNNAETLGHRLKLAEEEISSNSDDDEEESMFLFSYSTAASKILKRQFKLLFLPVFRSVYNELEPYSRIVTCATDSGVLTKGSDINNYYRSFSGKRGSLKKGNKDLESEVSVYEKKLYSLNKELITNSVMGQKSIFKALFDGFLSHAEDITSDAYSENTQDFITSFNEAYTKLCPSENIDENFFSVKYKISPARGLKKEVGSISTDFWKGIILKSNDEIDFSKLAIQILSQIIQDVICFYDDDEKEFEFTDYNKLVKRHERLIKKLEFEIEPNDVKVTELAEKVVKKKQDVITALLTS